MGNVFTFGCRLNFWESDKINQVLKEKENQNITVFNTCSVTNEAIKNTISNIKKFHSRNPGIQIAVTGCAVETNFDTFKEMKEVSFIVKNGRKLDPASWNRLPIKQFKSKYHKKDLRNLNRVNPSNSKIRKFIKIQNGCDHSCTFCIIPKCRGKSVSDNMKKINENIRLSLDNNIKEIILTGVDLTSWGIDIRKNLFLGDLIEYIFLNNPDDFRLRLSSLDAAELDDKFFEILENEKRLMPHFHFSLQSLNNMILKRMKRRHSVEQVITLFKKIRSISSKASFGADIITGFPTESEQMFLETKKLIEDLEISHLHVFPYSERQGTPASKMPQIPIQIRRDRARILRELGRNVFNQALNKQIYKTQRVLIENDEGSGKTENNFNIRVENKIKGEIIQVTPTKIENNFLVI